MFSGGDEKTEKVPSRLLQLTNIESTVEYVQGIQFQSRFLTK